MQKVIILLLPLSVCLLACNKGKQVYKGDVKIEIDIGQGLKNEVRLVSAVSKKPGLLNPLETLVELRNTSGSEARVLCVGTWLDDRDNYYGGNRSVIVLPPHQIHKIEAGTRSEMATTFKLEVNRTQMTPDELLTSSLKENGIPRAEGYGFTYTETPTSDAIPAWTLRGLANGEPFQAKTIIFSPVSSQWKLQIIDRHIDPLQGLGIARQVHPDIQVINIDLRSEPKRGDLLKKEMSFGGGHFQIKTSSDSRETTSWNADNAWIIQITEWDKKPWIEGAGTFQLAGTASGHLYISYKGSEHGIQNSWVSGTFENAAIVFYGKPF